MESKIIRVAQGKESTLRQLYINGIFQCYLLEDKIRNLLNKQSDNSAEIVNLSQA